MNTKTWTYKNNTFGVVNDLSLQEYYDSNYSLKNFKEFATENNHPNIVFRCYADPLLLDEPLVYHTRWNKCFWLESLRYSGRGNKLKAYITDVYNEKKYHYTEAKDLRFVEQLKLKI